MRITRRHLQVSLGSLWFLDGILQCQPFMFSRAFVRHILAPSVVGQPSVIADPLHGIISLVSSEPALANAIFAVIQLGLGLAILNRRFTRAALGASVAWALSVWVVGEGLGGVDTGSTVLNGAPGAALLYAVIAVLAWPSREGQHDERPSWLALPVWCALWVMAAGLELIHGNDSSSSLNMMLRDAESNAPGFIAGIDHQLARLQPPNWTTAGIVTVFVVVAIWSLIPGWTRQLSIGIGACVSLVSWFLFQGLGDLTSGQATDPNSGPLLVLLALAVIGAYSSEVPERGATNDPIATAIRVDAGGPARTSSPLVVQRT